MKDVNKEVINYYIKLAQKISKKKRIFFERKDGIIYFSDGCFLCSFSVERTEEFLTLCAAFGLSAVEERFTVEYTNGSLYHGGQVISKAVETAKENAKEKHLMFTGVSAYAHNIDTNVDVLTDKQSVYFYNEKYTKPLKTLYLNGSENNGWTWAVYEIMDIFCMILPVRTCDSLEAVVKIMNK